MPLFMDIHKHVPGLTRDALEDAHQKDLEVQDKHDVNYMKYWFNETKGQVMCLVDAPSKEAAILVHSEAHGLLPDEIIEVTEGS